MKNSTENRYIDNFLLLISLSFTIFYIYSYYNEIIYTIYMSPFIFYIIYSYNLHQNRIISIRNELNICLLNENNEKIETIKNAKNDVRRCNDIVETINEISLPVYNSDISIDDEFDDISIDNYSVKYNRNDSISSQSIVSLSSSDSNDYTVQKTKSFHIPFKSNNYITKTRSDGIEKIRMIPIKFKHDIPYIYNKEELLSLSEDELRDICENMTHNELVEVKEYFLESVKKANDILINKINKTDDLIETKEIYNYHITPLCKIVQKNITENLKKNPNFSVYCN